MANIEGKASALNVLTPMPRWLRFYRGIVFLVGKLRLWLLKSHLTNLDRLRFIHFGRWVVIPREGFPWLGPEQPGEDLHHDYYLFCSNFNGSWGQYLDAFSDVIPRDVNHFWRGCVKYPGAKPATPFLRYAKDNEIDTDYYYSAYPGASTRDIKAALELHAKLEHFAQESKDLSPDDFQREYEAFLARIQGCLGSTGIPPFRAKPARKEPAPEVQEPPPPPSKEPLGDGAFTGDGTTVPLTVGNGSRQARE
jgi:hypothetical protein